MYTRWELYLFPWQLLFLVRLWIGFTLFSVLMLNTLVKKFILLGDIHNFEPKYWEKFPAIYLKAPGVEIFSDTLHYLCVNLFEDEEEGRKSIGQFIIVNLCYILHHRRHFSPYFGNQLLSSHIMFSRKYLKLSLCLLELVLRSCGRRELRSVAAHRLV